MEKPTLVDNGKHYDLLVDWKKRLSIEIPFLTHFLENVNPPIKIILEVGCGTGHHAEILHKNMEYRVTGLDIEESMIKEAQKRVPDAEMFTHDFLDHNFLTGRSFDAIISLGNSVGLIAAESSFKTIITRFSQLLRKNNGVLIFHLLNTEKERNGWSQPRSVNTEQGEYIFLRGFKTNAKFVHPEIITLFKQKNDTKWQIVKTGRANIPRIRKKEMNSLLNEFGFSNIQVFGNYQRITFDPISSIDMIYVCQS